MEKADTVQTGKNSIVNMYLVWLLGLHWPICNLLQHMWDLWINCTQCYWYLRSRFDRAAQWVKRSNNSNRYSCCRDATALYRGSELLAGPQVPEFLTRLHGFCLCHIMAISLQNTLIIKKDYTRKVASKDCRKASSCSLHSAMLPLKWTRKINYIVRLLGRDCDSNILLIYISVRETWRKKSLAL